MTTETIKEKAIELAKAYPHLNARGVAMNSYGRTPTQGEIDYVAAVLREECLDIAFITPLSNLFEQETNNMSIEAIETALEEAGNNLKDAESSNIGNSHYNGGVLPLLDEAAKQIRVARVLLSEINDAEKVAKYESKVKQLSGYYKKVRRSIA